MILCSNWVANEMYEKFELPAASTPLLARLLQTIEEDIAPLTASGVAAGNKVFGAALLRKSDYSLVLAETNNELENPLWHGEMHCLKRFYEIPEGDRPGTRDLIFLSTHEPCSLCLSAITWAGFDNFFFYFSYENSRDSFAIPHDLKILDEVFRLTSGSYARSNAFWKCWSIRDAMEGLPPSDRLPLCERAEHIDRLYERFSETYQGSKSGSTIPLS